MARMIPALVLAFHCLMVQGGDQWPQFRGPEGDGHSDARNLPLQWSENKNVVWKPRRPRMAASSMPFAWIVTLGASSTI